jgi:hypothetical protein
MLEVHANAERKVSVTRGKADGVLRNFARAERHSDGSSLHKALPGFDHGDVLR